LKQEKGQEGGDLDDRDDVNDTSRSKITQAIKFFAEGKTPIDVVIALDLPADEVRAIYLEYWELKGMYQLAQIYQDANYDLHSLLRLHKIVKDLGMGEQEKIRVLELANHNQLQILQDKVEFLSNEVKMLEEEKANCTKHLLLLNKRIDEYMESMNTYESSLVQKREKMAMNRETRVLPRPINHGMDDSYSLTYSEPDINSYAIRLSYTVMDDLMDEIYSRQN
jgi:hypothetical protein